MHFRFILYMLLFSVTAMAQRAVVGLPKMNMVYIGLENPIEVAVDGIKPKDIVVKINGGQLKGENGKYIFVPDGSKRIAVLKVGYKKDGKIKWVDSVEYRVRKIDRPIATLETNGTGIITYERLMLSHSRINESSGNAGFVYSEPLYSIISYDIIIIGEKIFSCETVKGNEISQKSKIAFSQLNNGGYIIVNNIKTKWIKNTKIIDTIRQLENIIIQVQGNKFKEINHTLSGNSNNPKEQPLFETIIDLHNPDLFTLSVEDIKPCQLTLKNACSEKPVWTYNLTLKQIQRSGFYFEEGKSKKSIPDKNGFVEYSEFHENGKLHKKGKLKIDSTAGILEMPCGGYESGADCLTNPLQVGEWQIYYPNGKLQEIGNYDTISYEEVLRVMKEGDDPYNTYDTTVVIIFSVRHGLWKFYDEKGKLIRETKYYEGRKEE